MGWMMSGKMEKLKKLTPEWLTAGMAFGYYVVMALYKLTATPIWQDEALDFYCAAAGKGRIESIGDFNNAYERLIGLLNQPPLFGFLMSFWFRISESEWWLRFAGVVFGFVAAVGIYLSIRKLCDRYMAAFGIVIYSSIYILMYYVKELSEYIMIVAVMSWGVYIFLKVQEEATTKRIIMLTVFCVVALYSQYGALFAVIPMAAGMLVKLWKAKEFQKLRTCILSYLTACVAAGIPLVYFFFLPQSTGIYSVFAKDKEIIIENGNLFNDFLFSAMSVLRWFLIDLDRDIDRFTVFSYILLVLLVILSIGVMRKTRKEGLRALWHWNIATFLIYYIAVKVNAYAYGWYGNRYQLFLFPLWFVYIVSLVYEFIRITKFSSIKVVFQDKESAVKTVCMNCRRLKPVVIVAAVVFCMYGVHRIDNHWDKMDLKRIVNAWYELDVRDMPTYLDYNQRYSFTYYLTHDGRYQESDWDNIVVNTDLEPETVETTEQWETYLLEKYGNNMPDTLYLITSRREGRLMEAFEDFGYEIDPVVDYTAKFYLLTKQPLPEQNN